MASNGTIVGPHDGNVRLHDPNDEPKPELPMFHEGAHRAEAAAYDTNQRLQDLFTHTTHHDEQFTNILRMLMDKKRPRYEVSTMRVMVDGEAGKGKSFSINNILRYLGLSVQVCLCLGSQLPFLLVLT